MKQVFINGVDFTSRVEIDISFVEKLNRELDEGYISIPHSFKKSAFTMFDIVDILEDDTIIFSGRVAMDRVSVSSFNDRLFNHEISLIEHTKVLEKYIVKGKTVTQPVDFEVSPVQSLLDVVTKLRLTTPLELFGFQTSFRPFRIPQETVDLLDPIIAPEFNFKDLTLRQALDQVGSVIDSVARIDREGSLTFTQFDKLKEKVEIVTQDYQLRKNITDYANALESEMLNATDSSYQTRNPELQEVYPGENTYTTLRSTEFLFGFSDLIHIPTPRPIYKINELKFLTFGRVGIVGQPFIFEGWFDLDLSGRVLEYENWNTLEALRNQSSPDLNNRTNFFKNNTLYFRYGKKNVFVGELFGLFGTQNVFDAVIRTAMVETGIKNGWFPPEMEFLGQTIDGNTYGVLDLNFPTTTELDNGQALFRVYYTPLIPALRYQIHRDTIDEVDFYSEAIVNQQTRLVDVEKFGNNLKGRINQMAGSVIQLSHRVKNYNETFDVGDFVLDDGLFVITQKEVLIHRDFYNVNYELTKNFNKFSQFIGVDQEIRQSEIGALNRTIERDLLYSEYIEVEASDSGSGANQIQTLKDTSVILKTLDKDFVHTPIKFSVIKTDVKNENILVGLNKSFGGGALSLNFELEDNISAGRSNQPENSEWFRPNRRFNEPVTYSDSSARFERLRFLSYNEIPESLKVFEGIQEPDFTDHGIFKTNLANDAPAFDPQLLTGEIPVIEGEWFVAKDSREIIKFNLMYHFLSRDFNEVVIGNKFIEQVGLVKEGQNNIKLWIYNDRRFDTSDKNKPLEQPDFSINSPNITIDTSNNKIIINETIDEGQSYALVAENNFPYVMVNSNKTHLLFHFLNKRPAIQYLGITPIFQRVSARGVGVASLDFIVIEAIPIQLKSTGVGVASLDFDVEITQIETKQLSSLGVGIASLDFDVGLPATVERQLSSVGVGKGEFDIQILTPTFENSSSTSSTVTVAFSNPNPFTAELFVELGISGEFEFIQLAPSAIGSVTFEFLPPNSTFDINANMILGNFVSPTTVVFVNTTS